MHTQPAPVHGTTNDDATLAQQRFEALVNSIDGIVWEADPLTFRFSFVSAKAERLLGYPVEEWYEEGFWPAHIHPEDRDHAVFYCASQTRAGADHVFQYRIIARDGRAVWLKDFVTVGMRDGKPVALRGIMVDITEQKQAEEALRLSATVFENNAQGIAILDAGKRVLKVNAAFCAITGFDAGEAVGQPYALLPPERQDAALAEAIWKTVGEHGYWSGELRSRRKDGEEFVEQLSLRQVRDTGGAVSNYIAILTDISHEKAARDEIERLSYFDPLTGLPNRALLVDRLQHALSKAERHGHRIALLAIDVDRLAHINEVLGHHVGDSLLVGVADRLRALMSGTDTVSRHIGDEFTVVLEELDDVQTAAALAERVLQEIERSFVLEGHEVRVTASIGISIYPEDGQTPQLLLRHADVALHHAKDHRAGGTQFFCEDMNRASAERLQLESSLRLALQRQEFCVLYQPQVDLGSGDITGMEALVRWQHPQMGMVSPARFIPIAEETGHIEEIGLWVLREACRQTQEWHAQGYPHLHVAVNVSARQFRQQDFCDQVKRALEETGLTPDCLELELTESMIMQRPEHVIATMSELRELGVKFSIDDFGTGYSSLSQLKRFPIDTLKIDQSFTQDIGKDQNGAAITCAIIALANSMHLRVVAEGVETSDQRRFLVKNGCQCMQGYLFSRPIPPAEFLHLLQRRAPAALADQSSLQA